MEARDSLAIVIGASGGIGRALEARLRAEGGHAGVIGLSRSDDPPLDIESEDTIRRWARTIEEKGRPSLIIDATGFLHGRGFMPEKSMRDLDPEHLRHSFAVNAIGPALLMKHFMPLFANDTRCVFATISARVGSIADNHLGGWYSYRASKAALNQLVRTASIELKRTHPQAICVAVHPGTVDTALSAPFAKTGLTVRSGDLAAREILQALNGWMLPIPAA